MTDRRSSIRLLSILVCVLALFLTACAPTPPADSPALGAGFRYSAYGPDYDPGPDYWVRVGGEMAEHFEGAAPETLWIVGRLDGDGCRLNFPVDSVHELISGSEADENEAVLDLFDERGFRVWLQVEPGHAPVKELIRLVMGRYSHHPSVIGFGVDVEWYESTTHPDGTPVSDETATAWLETVRTHDADDRLFLKHWLTEKMPPTLRDGLLFVDDSQILPSLEAMVEEFAEWGRTFAPAPVGFQFGYPSDRPWWRRLENPPRDLGRAILEGVPNTEGLYWVDFTVLDVFPPEPGTSSEAVGYDPSPRPIVGVKIYEHDGDLGELLNGWKELGITTVFAGEEFASRDGFTNIARATGADAFVIFPILFAPDELHQDPSLFAITSSGEPALDDWVEFACPSRPEFRQRRIDEAVELVQRLRPTGLSLDFIRYFSFWEMVAPDHSPSSLPNTCFCPHCLERFAATLDGDADLPIDDPAAASRWIGRNAPEEWVRFKTETISSLVWEIVRDVRAVKPSIRINLHTVPWRTVDYDYAITRVVGQDRETLGGLADYLSPMCYSFMLHREPEWVASVVADTAETCDCPVLPSIQVRSYYRDGEDFKIDEFEAALRAALEPPSAGVVFWSWEQLVNEPERMAIVKRVLESR